MYGVYLGSRLGSIPRAHGFDLRSIQQSDRLSDEVSGVVQCMALFEWSSVWHLSQDPTLSLGAPAAFGPTYGLPFLVEGWEL